MTTRPASGSLSPDLVEHPGRAPSPAATELALHIAAFLGWKKAEDLLILDVSGPLAIVDYFIVATVRNTRQAQAIAHELDLEVKHRRGRRKRNTGGLETEDSNWVLLDFDDVVVHLFLPEARAYYGLDALWADAPRLPVPPPLQEPVAAAARPERMGSKQFQIFPAKDAPTKQ